MSKPIAMLRVKVVSGVDLKKVGIFSSDPFVALAVNDTVFKTKAISGDLNPTWNQSFDFDIFDRTDVMELGVSNIGCR